MKAAELRQAILQAAVQGKLVPQDPADEPASELITRIKAQKSKLAKAGKIKNITLLPHITEDEIPYDVPEGWAWCRLNDLFDFIDYRGATPNKISDGIPLITGANIKKGFMDYGKRWYISRKEYDSRKSRGTSKKGDILFTTEAPLGNVAIADLNVYSAGQRIVTFQAYGEQDVDNGLFMFFMLSPNMQKSFFDNRSGMTAYGIKASLLKQILIPVPPTPEQIRIREEIERLVKLCDELENVEATYDDLESRLNEYLPKSMLQAAVRGELVAQDPRDEPAAVLLQRIQKEKNKQIKAGKIKAGKPLPPITDKDVPYDLPAGWAWSRLGSIISLISGRDLEQKQINNRKKGIPYITGASAIVGESVRVDRWTECPSALSIKGDLLLSCKGSIGKIAFNTVGECHIARQIMALRTVAADIMLDYIYCFIRSHVSRLNVMAKSIIPGISREDILFSLLPCPPHKEQKRISLKLEYVLSLCARIGIKDKSIINDPNYLGDFESPGIDRNEIKGHELRMAARGKVDKPLSGKLAKDIDDLFKD